MTTITGTKTFLVPDSYSSESEKEKPYANIPALGGSEGSFWRFIVSSSEIFPAYLEFRSVDDGEPISAMLTHYKGGKGNVATHYGVYAPHSKG